MAYLRIEHSLSQRRACELSQTTRSTCRYEKRASENTALKRRLKALAYKRVAFGYRRLHALLRKEGFAANHKKIYRLYKQEGLSKRKKRKKRFAVRYKQPLQRASKPNQMWAMDFMSDSFGNSSKLRTLNIVDVYTRECPAIEVSPSLPSIKVIRVLNRLAEDRGLPDSITLDNGPEYTSLAIREWAEEKGVTLEYITPGKPTENGYVESFNGKFREECLDQNWFRSLDEAKTQIEEWRHDYNSERPHSSLGYMTPEEFARKQNINESGKSPI